LRAKLDPAAWARTGKQPAEPAHEVSCQGDNEAGVVQAADQCVQVIVAAVFHDHHEVDGGGPFRKLVHGETDEEPAGVKEPSERRFYFFQEALCDELLFGGELVA
jgi:hypothetical protein